MPRPKKAGASEPKKRSRNGCWPCKARKVKCGEEKPRCANCERLGETCDYSIRLTWGGRSGAKRTPDTSASTTSSRTNSPHTSTFPFGERLSPLFPPSALDSPAPSRSPLHQARSRSPTACPPDTDLFRIDPQLMAMTQAPSQPGEASFSLGQPFHLHHMSDFHFPPTSSSSFAGSSPSSAAFAPVHTGAPLPSPTMAPLVHTPSYDDFNVGYSGEFGNLLYGTHKRSLSPDSVATFPPDANSSSRGPHIPNNPFVTMPLTPNSLVDPEDASVGDTVRISDDGFSAITTSNRLSGHSFVAGPTGDYFQAYSPGSLQERYTPAPVFDSTSYGYDCGNPDLDTPMNDDHNAIANSIPPLGMDYEDVWGCRNADTTTRFSQGGGYYASPVPITISNSLQPLPPLLLENPMNLLYFHHFLNHTARILVPHDCGQNPFRQILPEMAVRDEKILRLLLAFSAAHRARLLNHPEPANRIAVWVQDVFPQMRASLANSENISNSTLAPAIMMASLEIISPNTFEVPISWQDHLMMARQMIIARGGARSLDKHDRVAYFLSRWFAYLDVLGSLSGHKNDQPLGSFYWSSENASADEDYQIDCLMGFTNRCVGILARIAELAKQCEPHRIDESGNIRTGWRPEPEIVWQAEQIRKELEQGIRHPPGFRGCNHRSADSDDSGGDWDDIEIYATNEMFHWAGLIHLFRRVLGKPVTDPEVQNAVLQIVALLYKIRRGSTAEACLLFPMFAAGCDAVDEGHREKIMERLRSVEGFGIAQIHKARAVMQKVWDTGKPWESLVSGEFFG